MKPIHTLLILTLVTAGLFSAGPARAADDPIEFLHALRSGGYPDVAEDYLNALKNDPKAPKEILDVWDWEMSRTLRAASKMAYNEKEAKQKADQAEAHLQKFIKENPKRPQAIRAAAEWAGTAADEALRAFRQAKELTDKDQKAEAMAKVRESLGVVRDRFAGAEQVNRKSLASTKAKDRNRPQLEEEWLDSRLKVAMTDFYIAMTYPRKTPERAKGMESAAKTFDQVYQGYRSTLYGLTSHYYTGRALQEEDKLDDAKEIYDEVLAVDATTLGTAAPETPKGRKPPVPAAGPLDDLMAEVEQHYLQCVVAGSIRDYLREVIEWRTQKKALMEKRDGYQAISFDMAKVYLKVSENPKTSAADKKKYTTSALKILSDMAKVPSQYQQDAIKLRRQLRGGEDSSDSAEEGIVDADEAAAAKKWKEAIDLYQKVLDLLLKGKDTAKIAAVRNAIAGCYYNVGLERFHKGDLAGASENLSRLLEDEQFRTTQMASAAAAVLLNVLLNQYNDLEEKTNELSNKYNALKERTEDEKSTKAEALQQLEEQKTAKTEALKRLTDTANKIIQNWPGKPEADAARLTLGRLAIFQGNIEDATKIFRDINPKSEHYVTALYLTGYTYWRRYRIEKRDLEAKAAGKEKVAADALQQIDVYRVKAVKVIERAVETLKATPAPDNKTPKMLTDAQILLAEMMAESGDPKAVVVLLQPLADDLEKSDAKGLDPVAFQICNGLVQAYLQLGEMDKAVKIGKLVVKLGPDAPNVNLALMTVARRLEAECKKAKDAADEAKGSSEVEAAKTKYQSFNQLLGELLGSLAAREKLTAASTVWLAQACATAGLTDDAEKVAKGFFDRMENDANFIDEGAKAVPRMRSLRISLLRQKGKFPEALDQVDLLIDENKKALEPRMERGWILQAWSERDPKMYAKAVSHWEKLRRDLEQLGIQQQKKARKGGPGGKPRELYEVTYNEALCLYNWAKKAGDKENAKSALKLLKQMVLLDPNLNGPETVSRFNALSDKVEILLGLEPSSKKAVPPRKVEAPKSAAPAGKE